MAQFNPSRKTAEDFNSGIKYKGGDGVQSRTINNLIESALWVQELAFGDAIILGDIAYETIVSTNDTMWTQVNNKWQFRIPQTTYKLTKIHSINAERKTETDLYENMVFSYKHYLSGTVAIIVDEKIDMRIIIKGEK